MHRCSRIVGHHLPISCTNFIIFTTPTYLNIYHAINPYFISQYSTNSSSNKQQNQHHNLTPQMLRQLTPHYARLGISPTATRAQLSAAYRAAALKHHPDRGGQASTFAAIRESYEVLNHHLNTNHVYQPASLRTFGSAASNGDSADFWGMFISVLAPTGIGLFLGVRLMYHGGDRKGLRAGGTSRFRIQEHPPVIIQTEENINHVDLQLHTDVQNEEEEEMERQKND